MPSGATTCGAGCFGPLPAIGPSLTGSFGDGNINGTILDDFVFTPPGPPPSGFLSNSDTITVSGGTIADLTIAIYTLAGNVLQAMNSVPTVVGPNNDQLISLDDVPVSPAVGYYIQITGSCAGCSYGGTEILTVQSGGNQGDTPIPAALPLFASGLGVLGFWGRRKRKQARV
jgi:hypothetical protein